MVFVAVYENNCTGCGSCVEACPNDILELKDGVCFPEKMDACQYCLTCVKACDYGAIKVFP
ncbi:4Fe-4S binding protein [Methanolobus profundi]|uniref:4Fe-4S binding domain-containing protein n=1 Tax=Methanolobus profundi TaxID=487685 RepID=A0A1I4Q125_9EURY|nr:4Fe-4S binding protein [Methanolobus profundi]SFM33370.1 4Fe-4S binding domain-containing protein [Methanolobus profundi]